VLQGKKSVSKGKKSVSKGKKSVSKGKKSVSKGEKPVSVHVLTDEWAAYRLDEEHLLLAGSNTGRTLDGDQFLIEKTDYIMPEHGRGVRSVRAWAIAQFTVMRGCRKPWLKEQRHDPALPILHPEEYIRRYFFAGMEWDDRLIQNTYFNLASRQVFFRFSPPVS
jgi:hypothetical protein